MNGLPTLANNLASQGRYGDSMLVHMSPGEVGGLQALAQSQGTSLTTNPDTGLPEAFKLKQLLPTLIGAGLSFIPGVGPLMAAGMVGGFETIRSGDLGKGLMAGLGAYGGANLGAALSSMGSSAAAASALPAGGATATGLPSMAQQAAGDSLLASSLSGAPAGMSAVPGAATPSFLQTAGSSLPANVLPQTAINALQNTATTNFAQQGMFDQLGQGAKAAFADPQALGSTLFNQMGTKGSIAAATPAAMSLAEATAPKYDIPTPEDPYAKYKGPYTPTKRNVRYPGLGDIADGREFSFFDPSNPIPFQDGGSVPMLEDGGFVLTKKAVDGLGKGDNKQGQQTARKGLGAIPIKGKGTGTSDSIKTSIDGKVPARVSNGEAYIPRRNVKQAGGADKLYALMRKAERRA
jgi:hypothetical protein